MICPFPPDYFYCSIVKIAISFKIKDKKGFKDLSNPLGGFHILEGEVELNPRRLLKNKVVVKSLHG